MNSSNRKHQDAFLVELANLGHRLEQKRAFVDRWEEFIPKTLLKDSPLARLALEDNARLSQGSFSLPLCDDEIVEYSLGHLDELSEMLRRAWRETSIERQQYFAHEVNRRFARMYFRDPNAYPPRSPFQAAIARFSSILDRTRFCEYDECSSPYYIAPSRRPRKYCGRKWLNSATNKLTECAKEARNRDKLEWWNKNRAPILKKRKVERKKRAHKRALYGE